MAPKDFKYLSARFPKEHSVFGPPNDHDLEALLRQSQLVVDTNFLLDFLRVSQPTAEDMKLALGAFDGRLFLPFQVALEFHRNLGEVHATELAQFKMAETDVTDAFTKLSSSLEKSIGRERANPHLGLDWKSKIEDLKGQIVESISEQEVRFRELHGQRPAVDDLLRLVKSVSLARPEADWYSNAFDEAKERLALGIPPGLGDKGKETNDHIFGDYLIWKECLDHSAIKEQDLVFVTSDEKKNNVSDWFQIRGSRTVGPNPPLRSEYWELSNGHEFYVYRPHLFLSKLKELGIIDARDSSIRELQLVSRSRSDDSTERQQSLSAVAAWLVRRGDNSARIHPPNTIVSVQDDRLTLHIVETVRTMAEVDAAFANAQRLSSIDSDYRHLVLVVPTRDPVDFEHLGQLVNFSTMLSEEYGDQYDITIGGYNADIGQFNSLSEKRLRGGYFHQLHD